jgi:hypothetical protein
MFGNNAHGQMGEGKIRNVYLAPTTVTSFAAIEDIGVPGVILDIVGTNGTIMLIDPDGNPATTETEV